MKISLKRALCVLVIAAMLLCALPAAMAADTAAQDGMSVLRTLTRSDLVTKTVSVSSPDETVTLLVPYSFADKTIKLSSGTDFTAIAGFSDISLEFSGPVADVEAVRCGKGALGHRKRIDGIEEVGFPLTVVAGDAVDLRREFQFLERDVPEVLYDDFFECGHRLCLMGGAQQVEDDLDGVECLAEDFDEQGVPVAHRSVPQSRKFQRLQFTSLETLG